MTNKKATRRALLSSLLSLLLCCSMLLGTTFAWFTDSVTSSGNIIKSGTLDVTMHWADGTEAVPADDSADWTDAAAGAIFNYDLWEPGYVEVRHIKIANVGTLALKYQLAIQPTGVVSKLADVIDVYFVDPAVQVADRTMLTDAYKVGTLTDVLAGMPANTAGELAAGADAEVTIALKMQETAGNDYQDLAIGSDFAVVLMATQQTAEADSFDNQYDEGAAWDGVIPADKPDSLVVDTAAKVISINDAAAFAYLNTLVNDADFTNDYGSKWQYTIELNTSVNLHGFEWTPIELHNFVAFDGKGHTISNLHVSGNGDNDGLFGVVSCNDIGVTYIKNLNINGAYVNGKQSVGAVVGNSKQGVIENVTVNDATVIGTKYVGGIFGWGGGSVNNSAVKNSTILITESGAKEAGGLIGYVSNDGLASTENKVISGNLVENVTVTAPTIASGLVSQPNSSNSGGAVIVIENNTVKNVTITTADESAAEFVSNNVGGKSVVRNNTSENVLVVKGSITTADELVDAFANLKSGDVLYITADIDMTGKTLAPVTGNKGFTMLGNGHTISNLTSTERGLFVAHSGSAAYTFDGVVLENCKVDTTAEYGGLFVGDGDTSDAITIKNCHVKNCSVKSAKYAAAFVAYTSGYNVQNNGPVYSDVLVENCSVTGGSITGGGSTGAAIGHSGGNDDTTTTIKNFKVDGTAINGEDAAHTGIVVGTANVGDTIIENVAYSNVTGNYNTATVLYGRFVPGTTGKLTIDGTAK